MLEKVYGIVLKTVKFSDAKMMAHVFTLDHGCMSFVVPVAHSKHSRHHSAFWAPLSMVEFQADIRVGNTRAPKVSDVRLYYNYVDLPYNPIKSTVTLFLAEFLSVALSNETANIPLYRFIETSMQLYDQMDASKGGGNFHLVFLLRLTRFLGILPNLEAAADAYAPLFDLQSATYVPLLHSNKYCLSKEESELLPLVFRLNYGTMHLFRLTRAQRSRLLDIVITYYRLHLPSFPELKSLPVLYEVFG